MSLSILVVGATGKQGGGAIDAILDAPSSSDKFKVFGLTRNTTSTKSVALADRGVTLLKADLKDYDSIVAALKESKAKKCVLVTDYFSAGSAAKETQQGINFLKAVEEVDPSIFVVLSSVGNADKATKVTHFQSKFGIEKYLKESSSIPNWFVLRPVAFFENLDDPANWNPLTKGKVKMLTYEATKVKYVSTVDVGKGLAAVAMTEEVPAEYKNQTLEFAMAECNGTDLAAALSEASGVPCTFRTAVPRSLLWLFMGEMWHMVKFFEDPGYSASIEGSKKLVPDGMDAKAWFESKGVAKWKDEE